MKVRMVQQMSGPRPDGQAWPEPGGVLTVSDEEGVELCHTSAGSSTPIAVPVGTEARKAVETADAPEDPQVEKQDEPAKAETADAAKDPKVEIRHEAHATAEPTVSSPPDSPPEPPKRGPGRPKNGK